MPQIDASPASGNAGNAPRRVLTQTTADYLISNWGGRTQHELMMANIKRSLRMLQTGEPACMLGMLHTPDRDAQLWFADTHLTPPHQFVVRVSALAQVPRNAAGEVSLQRVWDERKLSGAFVQGRSYGPELDEVIRRRPADTMSAYVTPDVGGNLLSMIAVGRADYTLEYDFFLTDHLAARGGGVDLVSLPIEGHAEPILSGVACPKNDWGQRVATRANEVLSSPQARRLLKDELLNGLSANARARYGARIDAFYNRPAPGAAASAASAPAGKDRVSPRSPSPPAPAPR
ncbi:hypothetical protein OU995_05035 [Roseateles sp. SL47]|uniref:hypothetical protein n=1 Tax=Roseateles sp. SL47 TaxID=2995138 RepID=UPI0022719310|nr:hypothetical protein [Roseateles sp. SL47]WAC74096.1 hypothetical protein OU995_05035 [Roseateles sp. SL47]